MSKTILIVDDDEATEGLDSAFLRVGLSPRFVSSTEDLGVWLQQAGGVLIPGHTQAGPLIRRIRQVAPAIPILFVGRAQASDPVRSPSDALALGGDYFFKLPTDVDYLAGRIHSWTQQAPDSGPDPEARPAPAPREWTLEAFAQAPDTLSDTEPESLAALRRDASQDLGRREGWDWVEELEAPAPLAIPRHDTQVDPPPQPPVPTRPDDPVAPPIGAPRKTNAPVPPPPAPRWSRSPLPSPTPPPRRPPSETGPSPKRREPAPEAAPAAPAALEPGEALLRDARQLLKVGQPAEALEALDTAATLFRADGQIELALKAHQEAVDMDPLQSAHAEHGADLALELGHRDVATQLLERSAQALGQAGRLEEARELWLRLSHLVPRSQTYARAAGLLDPGSPPTPAPPEPAAAVKAAPILEPEPTPEPQLLGRDPSTPGIEEALAWLDAELDSNAETELPLPELQESWLPQTLGPAPGGEAETAKGGPAPPDPVGPEPAGEPVEAETGTGSAADSWSGDESPTALPTPEPAQVSKVEPATADRPSERPPSPAAGPELLGLPPLPAGGRIGPPVRGPTPDPRRLQARVPFDAWLDAQSLADLDFGPGPGAPDPGRSVPRSGVEAGPRPGETRGPDHRSPPDGSRGPTVSRPVDPRGPTVSRPVDPWGPAVSRPFDPRGPAVSRPGGGRTVESLQDVLRLLDDLRDRRYSGSLAWTEGLRCVWSRGQMRAVRGPVAAARAEEMLGTRVSRADDALRPQLRGGRDGDEVDAVLAQVAGEALSRLLLHRGQVWLERLDPPQHPEELLPSVDSETVVDALIDGVGLDGLVAAVGGAQVALRVHDGARRPRRPRERLLRDRLEGTSLEAVRRDVGVGMDRAYAWATLWLLTGEATAVAGVSGAAPPMAPGAAAPKAAEPELPAESSAEPTPPAVPHRHLTALSPSQRIRQLAHLARTADYFRLLDVPRDAPRETVEASGRFLRSVAAAALESSEPGVRALAEEVVRILDEARHVLTAPDLRRAYQEHLSRG